MGFHVAIVFVDPKIVSWVSDVAYTVFKCLEEESGDTVDVGELLFVFVRVCAKNTEDETKYTDPHEHEDCKVEAINKSNSY